MNCSSATAGVSEFPWHFWRSASLPGTNPCRRCAEPFAGNCYRADPALRHRQVGDAAARQPRLECGRPFAQFQRQTFQAGFKTGPGLRESALQLFSSWGNAWDKRVQWDAWIAWARLLRQGAIRGDWPERLDKLNNVALRV